jgi:hypothetical protein
MSTSALAGTRGAIFPRKARMRSRYDGERTVEEGHLGAARRAASAVEAEAGDGESARSAGRRPRWPAGMAAVSEPRMSTRS